MRRLVPRAIVPALALAVLAVCASCSSGGGSDAGATTTSRAGDRTSTSVTAPTTTRPGAAERLQLTAAPKVSAPVEGGKYGVPYLGMPKAWFATYGYTEDEYFLSGEAVGYYAEGEAGTDLAPDGQWDVASTDATTPYETRVIVRRPKDPKDFSGTVVVEWLNVSAGRDSDPDFGFFGQQLLANGDAYVGVSAQKMGVEPGGLGIDVPNVPKEALQPLKEWDPERYGKLHHPGDDWSYDIFSQAGRAALETGTGSILGGLEAKRLIATGESQSAFRMVTYVDAVQPITNLFDGFLVHSRGEAAADLNSTQKPPAGVQIRTDTDVPVVQFETETDLDLLQFVKARQDDFDHLVTWEVAGTAHADRSTLDYAVQAGRRWTDANVDLSSSCGSINDGPQQPVVNAAFAHLEDWVAGGDPLPAGPRLDVEPDGTIVRDDLGIAKGGIRTPAVDAPTKVLTGQNPTPSVICSLFGSSTPLTDQQLQDLYADHDAYVQAVTTSADRARDDGYLLPPAAKAMVAKAKQADVPPA
ncbi:MAG: alpha/beta hydrolase domain-containing protein [Acidimicrobiales bacterium]